MKTHIKNISLETTSPNNNGIRPVRIDMEDGTYHYLKIHDLKLILKYWIQGEEEKYPQSEGFKGRWMIFDEIKKVFDDDPSVFEEAKE